MIARLTRGERRVLSVSLALLGLVMAAVARQDPMGLHGFMACALGLALVIAVGGALDAPEPPASRLKEYYDDPIKVGVILAVTWAVFGMGMGVWVAALMAWPEARA